jgi:RNA polymerase sigma-70 factor, ECF subfamily
MDSFAAIRLPVVVRSGESRAPEKSDVVSSPPETTDEALLADIGEGKVGALAALFQRHARTVQGIGYRILRDQAEAEDLVQDIFLLVHRCAKTFDSSKGSAQFWIVQMTYRRAISRRHSLNSRHFYTQLELNEQSIETTASGSTRAEAFLDRRLAQLDLEKLFRTLSEDQQKTLRLHFIEGYTLEEIAKMLGQTKGNIRHHSFRGLEKLRKLLFGGELPGERQV